MTEFTASLLREKFTITDSLPSHPDEHHPVVALSNRLVVPLGRDDNREIFVVRAQNMHLCVRIAAFIVREYQEKGPIAPRMTEIGWKDAYAAIIKGYEGVWNQNHWGAVYHRGNMVFQDGATGHHLFLDVIEQCDARNKHGYDKSLEIAQDAFKQAGRLVTITHDSNVAMLLNMTETEAKCGLIIRNPNRTTTFNVMAHGSPAAPLNPAKFLSAAAAYLECLQLCFLIGTTRQKVELEILSPASPEAQQADKAGHRLGRLRQAITEFEGALNIKYRPGRPDFRALTDDAAAYARRVLSG